MVQRIFCFLISDLCFIMICYKKYPLQRYFFTFCSITLFHNYIFIVLTLRYKITVVISCHLKLRARTRWQNVLHYRIYFSRLRSENLTPLNEDIHNYPPPPHTDICSSPLVSQNKIWQLNVSKLVNYNDVRSEL